MAQNDNATTGIGDDDLDENGQADGTHDQSETGGSGGAGLTRNDGDGAPAAGAAAARPAHPPTESGALGAGDTRAQQAGVHPTGLGSAETGANQTQNDMGPGH
jgi:hypothetical protein